MINVTFRLIPENHLKPTMPYRKFFPQLKPLANTMERRGAYRVSMGKPG
jgi:hypothetical protein